jgi:hypothetical protein
MKYQITVEESHKWDIDIEADSREEALDKANEIDLSGIEPDRSSKSSSMDCPHERLARSPDRPYWRRMQQHDDRPTWMR